MGIPMRRCKARLRIGHSAAETTEQIHVSANSDDDKTRAYR